MKILVIPKDNTNTIHIEDVSVNDTVLLFINRILCGTIIHAQDGKGSHFWYYTSTSQILNSIKNVQLSNVIDIIEKKYPFESLQFQVISSADYKEK
jgi:hypothetical protein